MSDTFLTITAPSEGKYTEKMSKFLSFAYPVDTVTEAKAHIARMQNEYHDARHVCWAYMVGPQRTDYLSSDNGEPSGTAGKPILGQINSFGLTNVVIIVVRYFGGIKLGTSGLISAYREAARLALDAADIVERHECRRATYNFPYMSVNEVMKVAKGDRVRVIDQRFDLSCQITIETNADDFPSINDRILAIDGVTPVPTP